MLGSRSCDLHRARGVKMQIHRDEMQRPWAVRLRSGRTEGRSGAGVACCVRRERASARCPSLGLRKHTSRRPSANARQGRHRTGSRGGETNGLTGCLSTMVARLAAGAARSTEYGRGGARAGGCSMTSMVRNAGAAAASSGKTLDRMRRLAWQHARSIFPSSQQIGPGTLATSLGEERGTGSC